MTTEQAFTEPAAIGNAYGPGRKAVICRRCAAVVLTPTSGEPDWLELHRAFHDAPDIQEPPC